MVGVKQGFIQIAGVIDSAEARLLIDSGVDWLGFPLRLTVNREDLSEEAAARVIGGLPSHVKGVVITYADNAVEVVEMCRKLGAETVQLHGEVSLEQLATLRSLQPELFVIKSLIVRGDDLPRLEQQVSCFAESVDAFITDTYDPATGACGATGKRHDWGISRRLVEMSPKPVILAGGLTPTNVREAILAVRPAGVDAHTGVEGADGRKDVDLVRRFVAEARCGFEMLGAGAHH